MKFLITLWHTLGWRVRVGAVISFVLLLLTLGSFVLLFYFQAPHPDFTLSPWSLTYSQGSWKLHLQADTSKYRVGAKVAGAKFVLANTTSYSGQALTNQPEYYQLLDNTVDALGDGYITFDLPAMSHDCFAVYTMGRVQKYSLSEGFPPSPSDAWMCSKIGRAHV